MLDVDVPNAICDTPQGDGQAQALTRRPGPPPEASASARLAWCFRDGIRVGLRTAGWLLMIMVPVSLAVKILAWSGFLAWIAQPLNPVFAYVGLPGETVVAFLTGVFLNIYSAIAALGSIALTDRLTDRQVTIFAMMALIAHNLPVESAVQHKAGTAAWRTVALRLTSSLIAALLLNWTLPPSDAPAKLQAMTTNAVNLLAVLKNWVIDTAWLTGKVIAIVLTLMILQRILKEFGVIRVLSRLMFPILWLLGLPRRLAFLWIVANVLGLAYGAAVILEEVRNGGLDKEDAQLLNRSMAVCHSLLEDTLLFVALGAWAFWITLPRLAFAAAVVWVYRCSRLIVAQARAVEAPEVER